MKPKVSQNPGHRVPPEVRLHKKEHTFSLLEQIHDRNGPRGEPTVGASFSPGSKHAVDREGLLSMHGTSCEGAGGTVAVVSRAGGCLLASLQTEKQREKCCHLPIR